MAIAKVVLNGTTKMDTTQVTVTAADLAQGVTALGADGTLITGTGGGEIVYVSSTGLLYTPVMTVDMTMGRSTGYVLTEFFTRYGQMPYLTDLTLTGVMRLQNDVNYALQSGGELFSVDNYPLLKKLKIQPTETRKYNGSAIAEDDAAYNHFQLGHYVFSKTNLQELTIGKLGGPYLTASGYFRNKNESDATIYSVGSTDGLVLKEYVSGYLANCGFQVGPANNTIYTEYDYQTGEVLTA